jgi:hypothetical protein
MDHQSLVRPSLPGKTPVLAGGKSVYGSNNPPHFEDGQRPAPSKINNTSASMNNLQAINSYKSLEMTGNIVSPDGRRLVRSPTTKELIRSTSAKQRQRVLQEKTLTKIVSKLPYDLRETVTAVLTMAFSTSENIQKDLDVSNQEAMVLKSELTKKIAEIHTLQKSVDIYKNQIKGLEENIETLKDNIDSRQKFSLKHRSAMTRLATTNRMLIDALDALEASAGGNPLIKPISNQSTLDEAPAPGRVGQLAPLAQTLAHKNPADHKEYEEKMKNIANSQNEKLRESLLKIAREHYRSMKNVEHLEAKVGELKLSLRAQEQVNRNLKTELDELKTIHLADAQAMEDNKASIDAANMNFKGRSFGVIDDRFKAMLERNLFDPIDGIQQLRRILAHMATAPTTLSLSEMIGHIVSKDSIRIFDSEMICLYLIKPGSESTIHKFTARSPVPTSYDLTITRSLAADTIRLAKVFRMNNLAKCANYNPEIDGCTGVLGRRILSLPLINTHHNMVIGAIEIINKGANNDVFAEIDEIFGLIFAYQASLLLTSCVMYDALFFHSQLLRGLLEASTDLYAIIPEPSSLAYSKSLSPSEVIMVVEKTARDLLKCPNVRAFLVSDCLESFGPGQFVFIQPGSITNYHKIVPNAPLQTAPLHSGIVGHVLSKQKQHLTEDGGLDPYWNPTVDLDPLTYSMMTVPIMDLNGAVMCCLQLLIGNRSPRLKQTDDPNDFRIFFGQAAEWLCHQLASPLKYLLDYIGRPAYRPVSTPSRISKVSADGQHRPSFFSTGEEAVSQMISNEDKSGKISDEKFKQLMEEDTFRAIPLKDINPLAGDGFAVGTGGSSPIPAKSGLKKFKADSFEEDEDKSLVDRKVRFHGEDKSLKEEVAKLEAEQAKMKEALSILNEQLEKTRQDFAAISSSHTTLEIKIKELEQDKIENVTVIEDLKLKKSNLEGEVQSLRNFKEECEKKIVERETSLDSSSKIVAQKDKEISVLNSANEQLRSKQSDWEVKEQKLLSQLGDLQSTVQSLKQQFTATSDQQSSLQDQVNAITSEKQSQQLEIEKLLAQVKTLEQKLVEKDQVQAILQDQIVKLANQNIEKIDQAISKPQDTNTAPTTSSNMGSVTKDVPSQNNINQSTVLLNNVAARLAEVKQEDVLPGEAQFDEADRKEAEQATASRKTSSRLPLPPLDGNLDPNSSIAADQTTSVVLDDSSKQIDDKSNLELPPGWVEVHDDYGRTYYYNSASGESSWIDPRGAHTETASIVDKKVSRGEWDQYFDDNGTEYWVNRVTGQSSWNIPAEDPDTYEDDVDEEDLASKNRRLRTEIDGFGTNASQYSISAGDYTIEL